MSLLRWHEWGIKIKKIVKTRLLTQSYFIWFVGHFVVNNGSFGFRKIVDEVHYVLEHFFIKIFTVQLKQIINKRVQHIWSFKYRLSATQFYLSANVRSLVFHLFHLWIIFRHINIKWYTLKANTIKSSLEVAFCKMYSANKYFLKSMIDKSSFYKKKPF